MWLKLKDWLKANLVRSLILFNILLVAGLSWGLWDKLKEVQAIYVENSVEEPKMENGNAVKSGSSDNSQQPKEKKTEQPLLENASSSQPAASNQPEDIKSLSPDIAGRILKPNTGITPQTPPTKGAIVLSEKKRTVNFLDVLLLMFLVGGLGGVLCNLRGIFEHYRDEKEFPDRLTTPYYVRPFSAAVCGWFANFLASFLVASVTYEAVATP